MTSSFDWKANGLDRSRFEGLTKLLRVRSCTQVKPPSRFNQLQHDAAIIDRPTIDDGDSNKAGTLTDFGSDRLRRIFLDRLAELVANETGGLHVAATMMVNDPDKVTVFVARNDKFRQDDVLFLERTEALLRLIAQGLVGLPSDKDGDRQPASELWGLLLGHYETRIHGYIVDLRRLLKQCLPTEGPSSESQTAESPLKSQLRQLQDACCDQGSPTISRNKKLVPQAHSIYKHFSDEDFADLRFPGYQKLRGSLGFLGRLENSFGALIRSAERLPGFENIKISIIQVPAHTQAAARYNQVDVPRWTAAQVFKHIGHPLTDDHVHSLLGMAGKKTPWTKHRLLQEFNKLKSSTAEVHAEMRLLPCYIQARATENLSVEYIGCSKNSCFLCWHFLDLFAGIRTRGCHGKLYHLWGLPNFDGASSAQKQLVAASVRDLERLVKQQILNRDTRILPPAKESTIGASTVKTVIPGSFRPSTATQVLEYMRSQRASLIYPGEDTEEPQGMGSGASSANDAPIQNTVPTAATCGNPECLTTTARRCSYCGGGWFCSAFCEVRAPYSHIFLCNRRRITTADILEQDCRDNEVPEDPQVREHYGFERCRNRQEECNLLGLYQGVIKYLDVSSEELHQWRTEGILADKIIETFSKIPEQSRGGYYPWFLRNRHVLDGRHEVVRDLDDVKTWLQERHDEARPYLDPADQNKKARDLEPFAKQQCFHFLALLLGGMHPPPHDTHSDLWYDFGFVVCSDTDQERRLAIYYQWLLLGNKPAHDRDQSLQTKSFVIPDLPTCSFTDFWKAWEAGTLMELFSQYGTSQGRGSYAERLDVKFPALREFLKCPGRGSRQSVWRLRQFLAIENANVLTLPREIADAALEYGFAPGLNTRTRLDLRKFYTRTFWRGVLPGAVDEARRNRNLHEMADRWSGGDVGDRVKQALRNIPNMTRED